MSFNLQENVNLSPFCSMKTGGNAKYFVLPESDIELSEAVSYFREKGEKYIVVGNCSNLLFPDEGFDGGVIVTSAMRKIEESDGVITAECGVTLSTLARVACEASGTGLEFCYGIPGTVGGGVYMNAGAYGGELSQCFISGLFLDENGEMIEIECKDMEFGYRTSVMNRKELVLVSAKFKTESGDKQAIRARMDELMTKRKTGQPLEYPSCGSAFKRPVGYYAGALIEQCGLKGKTIGGAQVSQKHAGFIINVGGASSTDVTDLLSFVSETVFNETGVRLEPEIRVIK